MGTLDFWGDVTMNRLPPPPFGHEYPFGIDNAPTGVAATSTTTFGTVGGYTQRMRREGPVPERPATQPRRTWVERIASVFWRFTAWVFGRTDDR